MTISDEISIIVNKLANEGKTPSVALIKSQLSQTTPLPKIIAVLKNWQHEPTFIQAKQHDKTIKAPTKQVPDDETVALLINKALIPLQQEVEQLKQQVKQLLEIQQTKK